MRFFSFSLPLVGFLIHLCSSEEASCPSIKWIDGVEVHDVSGYVDMMNDPKITTPQQCSELCCKTEGCVAFVYKDAQSPPAGNCTVDKAHCCWLKPTVNMSRLNETSAGCTSGYFTEPAPADAMPTVKLQHSGVHFPYVSLGTGSGMIQKGDVAEESTSMWLSADVGGTAIDTAHVYYDQANVTRGIHDVQPPLAREDYFLTTKCEPGTTEEVRSCIAENLALLQTTYVDVLLVHWPGVDPQTTLASWKAVQEAYVNGSARAIGVSSFLQADLEMIINEGGAPLPDINQASLSIGEHDDATIAYCASVEIVYESFSPLRKGEVLDYQEVIDIAAAHGVSAAQVALKWIVQGGFPLTTAITNKDYMIEDLDLWSWGNLTDAEMATLSAI